jgi:hypothetical protein
MERWVTEVRWAFSADILPYRHGIVAVIVLTLRSHSSFSLCVSAALVHSLSNQRSAPRANNVSLYQPGQDPTSADEDGRGCMRSNVERATKWLGHAWTRKVATYDCRQSLPHVFDIRVLLSASTPSLLSANLHPKLNISRQRHKGRNNCFKGPVLHLRQPPAPSLGQRQRPVNKAHARLQPYTLETTSHVHTTNLTLLYYTCDYLRITTLPRNLETPYAYTRPS